MTELDARALLSLGIHPALRGVEEKQLLSLVEKFSAKEQGRIRSQRTDTMGDDSLELRLIGFLAREIQSQSEELSRLRLSHVEFSQRYARAISEEERRFTVLEYSKALESGKHDLRADRRAFARWFGMDAMADRYKRQHAQCERAIVFCLARLGALSAHVVEHVGDQHDLVALWKRLEIERVVKPLFTHDGDSRVVIEAFRCLATALQALPQFLQEKAVDEGALRFIYRSSLESRQHVWVQCEALNLLQSLSPASFCKAIKTRLSEPLAGDDFFLRRRAVLLLGSNVARFPELAGLFPVVFQDESAFVRQAAPIALHGAPDETVLSCLEPLGVLDSSPQVRAALLLELPQFVKRQGLFPAVLGLMGMVLRREEDPFVLRVAVKIGVDVFPVLECGSLDAARAWREQTMAGLAALRRDSKDIAVRRWAGEAAERLWLLSNQEARRLAVRWGEWVRALPPGKRRKLPSALLAEEDPRLIGRVLSVIAQDDFGFDLSMGRGGMHVVRGHCFGIRLWRVLHELRNPSPDKRQAFCHTTGRIFFGTLRMPSAILSELAETKVPGEPLFLASESGWRPYLPLVDDMVSVLDAPGGSVRLFSSEGVTEIKAPRGPLARIKAYWALSFRFAEFARMRNWDEEHQSSPAHYVNSLRGLGFGVRFQEHADGSGQEGPDLSVSRFFGAGLAMPIGDFLRRLEDYFFSVYENSLSDLAVFTLFAICYFVGRHLYANWRIRKARQSLPLVIGGWGTRGKSGTERIKAAMINALGYGLVSKTTGCEAMFLYSAPYGSMREMFLFRPYDKATIWEQFDVMRHAEGLGADVFLWECMALTPSFLRILQHHWVRDDLSTITNTFPDHEDLQGPAGINIPEVMTNFIPRQSTLITTEEQMLPILREAALGMETHVEQVGWLEAGLLVPEVLNRFPYDEHPSNIALVLRMGERLGVAKDFALKEMADRVVPDLGVLKTFPESTVAGRRLVFVNGMSANERFGCLGNWVRMGFDRHDPDVEPGTWISTVVNNRADRVARSRVFAGILVNDISADRHFLIGSNLEGLYGYIEEAWSEYARRITLWPDSGPGGDALAPLALLQRFAKRRRVAICEAEVRDRLRAMLRGLGQHEVEDTVDLWRQPQRLTEALVGLGLVEYAPDLVVAMQRLAEELEEYNVFFARLGDEAVLGRKRLDQDFRQLLYVWFKRRIVVVHDFHATGDAIVEIIRRETPPGYLNKVMGIQNIKGTGLDFVYRWQAWDACYRICIKLRSAEAGHVEQAVRELAAFQEFGLLSDEYVRETLRLARQSPFLQREGFQAEINIVESRLDVAMKQVRTRMNVVHQGGLLMRMLEALEALLDAGDAVKRRRLADRIYRDLIGGRISVERAVLELQTLNKRQKGGWLLGQVHQVREYVAGA